MAKRRTTTVGMRMYEDMHEALKEKSHREDIFMYEIVDAALRAYGINPDEPGAEDNENDSHSEQ
ncbi:hypothetical protein J4729_15655 [Leisingera sp. HS039]|uniref:hypothetical protein n=1 Tax=Leisingera sp. HS039 TaxID=2818496 RepID=UPI001B3A57E8|nr:hypothetical protein [Leisingera sp. HS039]MBQ4825977.1 hypothetical protein [Leisingera sp. HS039]